MFRKSIHRTEYACLLRRLKQARKDAGLTQQDMAAALGCTQSAISAIEQGDRRLDVLELRDACRAMGVGFTAFITDLERDLAQQARARRRAISRKR